MNNPKKTNQEHDNGGFGFYLLVLMFFVAVVYLSLDMDTRPVKEITYKEFQTLVDDNKILGNVIVSDTMVKGTYVDTKPIVVETQIKETDVTPTPPGLDKDKTYTVSFLLMVNLKNDTGFLQELKTKNVSYVYREEPKSNPLSTFINIALFMLLIMFLFRLIFNRANGGKGGGFKGGFGMPAFGIKDSKFAVINPEEIKVSFKDVQGIDEVKAEVQEIIDFISNPEKFEKVGATIPHGILLQGEPGTGKTMLAKAIAKESGSPFIPMAGSEFVEMFVGLGAQRVRGLFSTARELAQKSGKTCIIFIDEIDAVGGKRGNNSMSGGHSEQEQTLNQLLAEIDGFATTPGHVVIIGATNRAETLDPALRREGRFDRTIVVPLPDVKGREKILEVHTRQIKKIPLASDVDLQKIARGCAGFSGAKLEALANEAAIFAARENRLEVHQLDFEKAKDKILMGLEQRSLVVSEKDRRKTAIHEAGHAILNVVFAHTLDPLHKVSIVPRGQALGVTMSLPSNEKDLNITKSKCEALISMMMGGRIAEEICFEGELSTGASNDIEKATMLARGMVYSWGMSDLGPINFENDNQFNSKFSEDTRAKADSEVRRIINQNYEKAKQILKINEDVVNKVADLLMLKETIDGAAVEEIYQAHGIKQ